MVESNEQHCNGEGQPSQAELYDHLRVIGELEDQKQQIQANIDDRTKKLQDAIPQLDQNSLLYSMLTAALAPKASAPPASPKTVASKSAAPKKKATKKKTTRRKKAKSAE